MVLLYKYKSLDSPLSTLPFQVSPATMKVHYDPDIRLLYLTGKVKQKDLQCIKLLVELFEQSMQTSTIAHGFF